MSPSPGRASRVTQPLTAAFPQLSSPPASRSTWLPSAPESTQHMWRIPLLVLLSSCLAAAEAAKAVPTGEETQILERLNQHRANWVAGDQRITEAARIQEIPVGDQIWSMDKAGAGQSPPLVFNPELILVARALLAEHATPVAKGRFDAAPAMKANGYDPGKTNLAMFAYDAGSLSIAYEVMLTNVISEVPWYNNTMRPILANSEALKPEFREAGVAVGSAKGKVDVVIVLGNGTAKRYLGGICYADANRDGRYAVNEGKAGVVVSCAGSTMTTDPAGAWWLPLESADATDVTLTSADQTITRTAAKGAASQQINWRIPSKADLKDADRLIADAEKAVAGSDDERTRAALVKLLVGTRMKILDDDRTKHITTLVDPIQSDFKETLHQIESSLNEEPDEIMKRFSDQKKAWKNAMPAWFKSAEALAQTHQQLVEFLAASAEQQEHLKIPMVNALKAGIAQPGDPSFLEQYLNWLSQVDRTQSEAIGDKSAD